MTKNVNTLIKLIADILFDLCSHIWMIFKKTVFKDNLDLQEKLNSLGSESINFTYKFNTFFNIIKIRSPNMTVQRSRLEAEAVFVKLRN
jgi:hypothetical protein